MLLGGARCCRSHGSVGQLGEAEVMPRNSASPAVLAEERRCRVSRVVWAGPAGRVRRLTRHQTVLPCRSRSDGIEKRPVVSPLRSHARRRMLTLRCGREFRLCEESTSLASPSCCCLFISMTEDIPHRTTVHRAAPRGGARISARARIACHCGNQREGERFERWRTRRAASHGRGDASSTSVIRAETGRRR